MPEPGTHTGPIWIPGHPVPKGSMKCVARHAPGQRARLIPDERHDPDAWASRAPAVLALRAPHLIGRPLDSAVCMIADFYLARPKTSKFPDAPVGHGSGDADKFTRMLGDAMQNAGIITDDSRIAEIHARKLYAIDGQGEGARVELRPVSPLVGDGVQLPVRIQVGRVNALVGHMKDPSELPALLRAVADQIEKGGK